MSAITGLFYRDGRDVDLELIKKINSTLSHRGPNRSAVYCKNNVALGHQMLWTTSESVKEKLPFYEEKSGLIITADARIDNRTELSKELDIKDTDDISDSYFILKSYQKWGEKCPKYLLGDFSFAIWDNFNKKIFCARDHMGIKPFYYYLDDNLFTFATEIKAILNVPNVPRELNEETLANLLIGKSSGQLTFYQNIKSLKAANFLELDNHNIKIEEYWDLNPKSKILMDSEEDYIKAFLKIFEDAVKCRLRSYFPIGFELSGGLDSASIIGMAKRVLKNEHSENFNINTFSFISDNNSVYNEQYYINKIISDGDINPHFVNADEISPLEGINKLLKYHDQPFVSPHKSVLCKLYEEMQKVDSHVLLTGEGGDDIISYGKYHLLDLALNFQWKELQRNIEFTSLRSNKSRFELYYETVIIPLIPDFFKNKIRKHIKDYNFILNKNFAEKLGIDIEDYINKMNKRQKAREHHYNRIKDDHQQEMLESIDRTIAPYNMEVRHPFYDIRLIEFCYAIPTEMKFKLGWNRYILRMAMQDIIPPEVQWNPEKSDLTPIFARNLLLYEEELLKTIILQDNEILKEFVDIEKLKQMFKEYYTEKSNYDPFDIWIAVLIFLWLEYSEILDS
jgi:asparagine synthase (glutamine-hydrolysing)